MSYSFVFYNRDIILRRNTPRFNTYSRREASDPGEMLVFGKLYSADALKIHRDWVDLLYNSMTAKVVVAFGQDNQRTIRSGMVDTVEHLKLWDGTQLTVHVAFQDSTKQVVK